jgi:hypothetical protein
MKTFGSPTEENWPEALKHAEFMNYEIPKYKDPGDKIEVLMDVIEDASEAA